MTTINLDKALAAIDRVGDLRKYEGAMNKAAILVRGDLSTAPPKKKGAFTRLATRRQKAAYWIKVWLGIAKHGPSGYIRTNITVRSWQTRVSVSADRYSVDVFNPKRWVFQVQGKDQTAYHKASGWPTIETVRDEREDDIVKIVRKRAEELSK